MAQSIVLASLKLGDADVSGDLPDQMKLFETGEPVRARPTETELATALNKAVKLAVWKRHRGRPPHDYPTFEDLYQEVTARALKRLENFRHGGRFKLEEFAYVAACYALCDIHRANMARKPIAQTYPLWEAS